MKYTRIKFIKSMAVTALGVGLLKPIELLGNEKMLSFFPSSDLKDRLFSLGEKSGRNRSFDKDWLFIRGEAPGAETMQYDDSNWRKLDLPHDWSIEDLPNDEKLEQLKVVGPFSQDSPGGPDTGHVIGGTGWYRKHFTLNSKEASKQVSILFDGVYMCADLWINGHYLGNHPYGYTSFTYELTPYLKDSKMNNIVVVRVTNIGKNSRWYSGSGIYRHVQLIFTNKLHFLQEDVFITTPEVSNDKAMVKVVSRVHNEMKDNINIKILICINGPDGNTVTRKESIGVIMRDSHADFMNFISLGSPQLWSPDHPILYQAQVFLFKDEKVVDEINIPFGIRSIHFDAKEGFLLNGVPTLLKGGCMHHDNGPIGAVAIDRAEQRRVELIKAHGFNVIRTSHNPPSSVFLDACDRLGILVIDEAFDCWDEGKKPNDYHQYFEDWWDRDITSMIKRDRNHPCVIMWSIGNEIPNKVKLSGLNIENRLVHKVRQLDPTRPVIESIDGTKPWSSTVQAFALLDIGGYNYQWKQYEEDHKDFPNRVMVGTESVPKEAYENWNQVVKHPWVIGDFVWTAMDYIGESGIGHNVLSNQLNSPLMPWPWYISNSGDIDICGFKKPQSYYRDVVWKRSKLEMAVHVPIPEGLSEQVSFWGWPDEQQSWNWQGQDGKIMKVKVYSTCPEVRLELNGQVVGRKNISEATKFVAEFNVPYAAGLLTAIGLKDGKEVISKELKTSGKSVGIHLSVDRSVIRSERNDLAYVTVEIVDHNGSLVPDADIAILFALNEYGELAAVANGNPKDMHSFQQNTCRSYQGRCLVILRPKDKTGSIVLQAKSKGLTSGKITIKTI